MFKILRKCKEQNVEEILVKSQKTICVFAYIFFKFSFFCFAYHQNLVNFIELLLLLLFLLLYIFKISKISYKLEALVQFLHHLMSLLINFSYSFVCWKTLQMSLTLPAPARIAHNIAR